MTKDADFEKDVVVSKTLDYLYTITPQFTSGNVFLKSVTITETTKIKAFFA